MNSTLLYYFFGISLTALVFLLSLQPARGQQSDTAQTTKELEEQRILQPYQFERSTTTHIRMPSSGTYGVPEPKEYYQHPFLGQKYLDIAMAAYRESLKEGKGGLLLRFLNKIAPFINNQFQFGVYRIYDFPIIERGHPLLEPQMNSKTELQKKLESDKEPLTKPGEEGSWNAADG